jgi:archaellum component FlaG (FlaF/FlaG flagellin family)
MKKIIFIVSALFFTISANAQELDNKLMPKFLKAEDLFDAGNYLSAIPLYKEVLDKAPHNKFVMAKLAVCYIKTRTNRDQSVKLLEKLVESKDIDPKIWYYLGKAYHLNNKLDDAIAAYENYKTFKLKKKEVEEVNRQIEMCKNAKQLMQYPVNVIFTNIGKEINTEFPEYYPFVDENETILVFTSRRKTNIGGGRAEADGYRSSDVWISTVKNNVWDKPISAGKEINTKFDEMCVFLNPEGNAMLVYVDRGGEKFGDLYLSIKDKKSQFGKLKPLPEIINDPDKIELSGCFNRDSSIFFFVRKDKLETTSDIFMVKKLPNGRWGSPQKLPEQINTPYNEDFPYLAPDGVTFYFASEGHNSIGGYDIFKSIFDPETGKFTPAENLGYPINSTDDDMGICVTKNKKIAYVSAYRPTGYGDLDIYRIKFMDEEQATKIFKGKIFMKDTTQKMNQQITIIATNKKTNDEYTFSSKNNGEFILALEEGEYTISVDIDGFLPFKKDLKVSDIGTISEEELTIVLQPK